jgi:hypothetical protein
MSSKTIDIILLVVLILLLLINIVRLYTKIKT